MTGHLRIDLSQPLSQGNLTLFQGESNTGKLEVAFDTAREFLDKEEHEVVVSSFDQKRVLKFHKSLSEEH